MATTKEVIAEFSQKSILELQEYAEKNNIDIVGAESQKELLEAIVPFIPREDEIEEKKAREEAEKEKIALFSKGNIFWSGVGSLTKGYNIVTKEASVKWLTKKSVREATPQEVAKHYGKI
jgi:hypothetical protein